MGFYGNITNTSKTQFQFDRIYPNRKMMDENAGTDGIYMGRYVLIEYDINDEKYLDNYPRLFKYDDKYYYVADMQNNLDSRIEVKYGEKNVEKGRFFRVTEKLDLDPSNGVDNSIYVLYKCTGSKENNIATFSYVSGIEETNDYARNYNIDIDEYGPSRGWDSTVWQKVFVGGDTKYVMIAELNTVVPTFGITVDAPTMNPIVPHFDQESNNIYYKLHLQPSWGMRVKEGEANKSDEEVIWKSISYDPVTDKETAVEETKKGAIYYNKAGFSKENIVYSPAGTKDKVTIEPTGKSGTEYNVHNESAAPQTKKVPDIQEVSIILPSIGDSIAEMWDLVYGNSSQNNGTKRNTDVDWDSTDGLRMVNVSEDGNGWTYDPDKVETLAGGINAIHDLMGMIIVDKDNLSETDIDELNLDGIYYDKTTGTYNRKAKYYEYTAIENKSIDPYEAKNVTLTEDTYKPNIYYLNQDLTEKDNGVVFDNTKTYYEKHLNAQPMGTKVEGLIDWAANTYFYKNVAGNIYTLDKSESPDDDKVYYNIDKIEVDLPVTYEKGKYWYKQKRDSVDGEYYDYFRENLDIPQSDKNIKYYTPTFTEVKDNLLPYRENTYATLVTVPNSSPEVKIYVIDKDGFNADVEYYALSSYTIVTEEIDIVIKGEDGTEMPGKQTIEKIKYDKEPEKIKLFDPSEKKYYYKLNEDTYKIFDNYNDLPANTTKFYTIEEGSQIEEFYISEKYYYQKYPGVFVLDEEKVKVNGRIYYKIENEKRVSNFYRPDTYYYKRALDGEYVLDINEKMTLNREYYLGEEFYVYEDTLEVFDKYSLWNNNVTTVPHTVTLARREAKWGYKELVGFARSMNTIHGLILEINKIMEFENEATRDLNTVQGCINKLKDIIFKFDQLVPGTFVIVDSYGRAHSADYTTKQSYSAINKNTGNIISTIDETEDRWIDLDINDNAKESTIYIRHNYTSTENSNSFVDKNNEETDIIKTYYPIVDNTGHIVGDHYETITLPYGFKTITTNGRGTGTAENATEAPEKTNVVAENIQDTLAINSGNRWIRIDTNSSDDSLTFSHDIHNTSSTTSFQNLSDEESEKVSFNIPTYFFDEAGHYTSHDLKILEMPFGYGKIIGDSGSTAATATFDTITFGSDDWLTATVSKDKVVYSHDYPAMKNDTTSTSDVNGNRDTIVLETLTHDEKGHVININKETVTLPYGYKTFKDSNPTVGNSVASNTQDTFVFKGDSWINPTVSNDLLTLTHTGPIGTAPAAKNAIEPNFGDTFVVEDWYFDDKGHKYAGGTHTVKIPQPSIVNPVKTNASVLTELNLESTKGEITVTNKNVGELTLTGYAGASGPNTEIVTNTDSINSAFGKIQGNLYAMQDEDMALATSINKNSKDIEILKNTPTGVYLNAKNYGAKGDGITDDSAALNAWLTALATTGYKGYLPSGTYIIKSSIGYNGNGTIGFIGESTQRTIIKAEFTTGNMIFFERCSISELGNFTINQNETTHSSNGLIGLHLNNLINDGISGTYIHDIVFDNIGNIGCMAEATDATVNTTTGEPSACSLNRCVFERVYLNGATKDSASILAGQSPAGWAGETPLGIRIKKANRVMFRDCVARYINRSPFGFMEWSNYCSHEGCQTHYCGEGIYFRGYTGNNMPSFTSEPYFHHHYTATENKIEDGLRGFYIQGVNVGVFNDNICSVVVKSQETTATHFSFIGNNKNITGSGNLVYGKSKGVNIYRKENSANSSNFLYNEDITFETAIYSPLVTEYKPATITTYGNQRCSVIISNIMDVTGVENYANPTVDSNNNMVLPQGNMWLSMASTNGIIDNNE